MRQPIVALLDIPSGAPLHDGLIGAGFFRQFEA
jgi:hypothetical protein